MSDDPKLHAMVEALRAARETVEHEGMLDLEGELTFDLAEKLLDNLASEPNGKLVRYLLERLVLSARAESNGRRDFWKCQAEQREKYQRHVDRLQVYLPSLRALLKKQAIGENPAWSENPGTVGSAPRHIARVLSETEALIAALYDIKDPNQATPTNEEPKS